ncbi:unnamed protein product, partial [Cyprideis torosa]
MLLSSQREGGGGIGDMSVRPPSSRPYPGVIGQGRSSCPMDSPKDLLLFQQNSGIDDSGSLKTNSNSAKDVTHKNFFLSSGGGGSLTSSCSSSSSDSSSSLSPPPPARLQIPPTSSVSNQSDPLISFEQQNLSEQQPTIPTSLVPNLLDYNREEFRHLANSSRPQPSSEINDRFQDLNTRSDCSLSFSGYTQGQSMLSGNVSLNRTSDFGNPSPNVASVTDMFNPLGPEAIRMIEAAQESIQQAMKARPWSDRAKNGRRTVPDQAQPPQAQNDLMLLGGSRGKRLFAGPSEPHLRAQQQPPLLPHPQGASSFRSADTFLLPQSSTGFFRHATLPFGTAGPGETQPFPSEQLDQVSPGFFRHATLPFGTAGPDRFMPSSSERHLLSSLIASGAAPQPRIPASLLQSEQGGAEHRAKLQEIALYSHLMDPLRHG